MIFFTGCRELYSVMCWLLCGYLRFGHLWPPQWQHHDQEVWTHVPYWLWKDPGQCPNAWEHQEVNRWMYTLYVGNNLSTSDIVHVHIRCDPSDHLGLDSKISILKSVLVYRFCTGIEYLLCWQGTWRMWSMEGTSLPPTFRNSQICVVQRTMSWGNTRPCYSVSYL